MSHNIAVQLTNVSKKFKLFQSQQQSFLYHVGLKRLIKNYKEIKTHHALKNINLQIKKGEKLGILGANGAGKSTLLKIIAGLMQPSSGSIKTYGQISSLFTIDGGTHEDLTGMENILKMAAINGISPKDLDAYTQDIIEFSELADVIHNPIYTYSLGMKMRLQFAITTAIYPEILIIDEVLAAGDAYFIQKSHERLKNLIARGSAFILVSHSTQDVQTFCDRAIFMKNGEILVDDTPEKVTLHYAQLADTQTTYSLPSNNDSLQNTWIDLVESKPVAFIQNTIINQELADKKITLTEKIADNKAIKFYSKDSVSIIKNRLIQYKSTTGSALLPGDDLSIKIALDSGTRQNREHLLLRIYDNRALCAASFHYNLKGLADSTSIKILISPLILGSGDYQIALEVQDANHQTQELYPNWFSFLINYTNDFDPPLFHIPGEWQFENEATQVTAARISSYQ